MTEAEGTAMPQVSQDNNVRRCDEGDPSPPQKRQRIDDPGTERNSDEHNAPAFIEFPVGRTETELNTAPQASCSGLPLDTGTGVAGNLRNPQAPPLAVSDKELAGLGPTSGSQPAGLVPQASVPGDLSNVTTLPNVVEGCVIPVPTVLGKVDHLQGLGTEVQAQSTGGISSQVGVVSPVPLSLPLVSLPSMFTPPRSFYSPNECQESGFPATAALVQQKGFVQEMMSIEAGPSQTPGQGTVPVSTANCSVGFQWTSGIATWQQTGVPCVQTSKLSNQSTVCGGRNLQQSPQLLGKASSVLDRTATFLPPPQPVSCPAGSAGVDFRLANRDPVPMQTFPYSAIHHENLVVAQPSMAIPFNPGVPLRVQHGTAVMQHGILSLVSHEYVPQNRTHIGSVMEMPAAKPLQVSYPVTSVAQEGPEKQLEVPTGQEFQPWLASFGSCSNPLSEPYMRGMLSVYSEDMRYMFFNVHKAKHGDQGLDWELFGLPDAVDNDDFGSTQAQQFAEKILQQLDACADGGMEKGI